MPTDPFAHHGHSPDVNAALAAQEKRDRIDAAHEVEPEPDLRQAVRELAEIVSTLCAWEVGKEIRRDGLADDLAASRDLHERAAGLLNRLA